MLLPFIITSPGRALVGLRRAHKIALLVAADLLALPLCALLAGLLLDPGHRGALQRPDLVLPTATTVAAWAMADLYRAVTRYIEQRLLAGAGVALGLAVLCLVLLHADQATPDWPRRALLLYGLLAGGWLLLSRLALRGLLLRQPQTRTPVAIYGAGSDGAQLALALRHAGHYAPVCFFDQKHGCEQRIVASLRVFHPDHLQEVLAGTPVRLIVVALPGLSLARLSAILDMLGAAGVAVRCLPQFPDLATGHAGPPPEIALEALLGRAPVPPDPLLLARCVRGKSVLVTGAGGSIGSELCRQIAALAPRRLHLLDHSEYALYTIARDLRAQHPQLLLRPHLGSVCSSRLLERIMQDDSIDTVYHAAAYKHVAMVEDNPVEGLRNNVLGARALVSAADKYLVQTCVLISSDKAVRPSNVMGASKRIAELIFQDAAARPGTRTTFCMVRFGNVLGSSGSVVPLFLQQLQHGGPLTITDPAMSRYFMLIAEAAQLVIQAGAMASGGEVFVLDMGAPVRILDLARSLIALAGRTEKTALHPGGDIEIRCIGRFPGEKLHEELLATARVLPCAHPRVLRAEEAGMRPALLAHHLARLQLALDRNDRWLVDAVLRALMPAWPPAPPDGAAPAAQPVQAPAS